MEISLKPQPLISEVLPGFTTLCILGIAYLADHSGQLHSLVGDKNTAEVVTASLATLLAAWFIGTVFDTIRDLIEHIFDRWLPVNWQFLFNGPEAEVQKIHDSWLAYYFLSGNSAIGLVTCTACGISIGAVHIIWPWLTALLVCALLFVLNCASLRSEIRRMIGFQKNKSPHDGVYARIKPVIPGDSPERGVGLFAIRDIPKGTLVFAPDDDPTVIVQRKDVEWLPEELQCLYQDFCVLDGDRYTCPMSFNKLTPSWYANNSEIPNIAPDKNLRFRAIRDIVSGEELTSRYEDYSENEEKPLA